MSIKTSPVAHTGATSFAATHATQLDKPESPVQQNDEPLLRRALRRPPRQTSTDGANLDPVDKSSVQLAETRTASAERPRTHIPKAHVSKRSDNGVAPIPQSSTVFAPSLLRQSWLPEPQSSPKHLNPPPRDITPDVGVPRQPPTSGTNELKAVVGNVSRAIAGVSRLVSGSLRREPGATQQAGALVRVALNVPMGNVGPSVAAGQTPTVVTPDDEASPVRTR